MKKAILKGLLLGGLLTCTGAAVARGYYEFIPYYGNDPFLFCTLGVPTDCWAPISAPTGTFTVTNYYCFNAVSAAQFARVCPHAFIPEASVEPWNGTRRAGAMGHPPVWPHAEPATGARNS